MTWRTLSTVAALSLILPLSTYAAQFNPENSTKPNEVQIAQIYSRQGRGWQGRGMPKFLEQLDLTDEQSAQIEAIHEQYRAVNEQDYQKLQQARESMRSLFAQDANPNQLRQQHQEIQSLRQQLGNRRFETMLQVREILTSEQRQQMAELMEQHRGKRGGYHHNRYNR